jgi:serine/threonine-protein kinase
VLHLLEQVCESLGEAHSVGLVHRDLKPSNIYVCRVGLHCDFVKVLDFGLAKHRRADAPRETLSTIEHTTGTPAYMAPEAILGGDVDRRADVYSLGCVAYFLLTGALVFEADTPMKVMVRHVQDRPEPPSQRTELPVPGELDALVMACLEKDPARRPPDALELLGRVRACRRAGAWSPDEARGWWMTHLPELCADLPGPTAA